MKRNSSETAMSILEKLKFQAIQTYFNGIGGLSENEYMKLYNHYAQKAHKKTIRFANDIYTERNDQTAFILYIIKHNDEKFRSVELAADRMIFEK